MATETQYIANTGMTLISSANTYHDGTDAVAVITGAENGTLIRSVTIIATGDTDAGIVRLFVYNGTYTKIIAEVKVPATSQSATEEAFKKVIQLNYYLESGCILKASTEKANGFNIICEGLDWKYYSTSVRPESTRYTAKSAFAQIDTANANLDGRTGSYATVLETTGDTLIQSIDIKAFETVNQGMVRIFIYVNESNVFLLAEAPVNYTAQSSTSCTFSHRIDFDGRGFALESGMDILASTEKGEKFAVFVEALEWTYPA